MGVVKTAWPEVAEVFDVLQVQHRAYQRMTLPYAVVSMGPAEPAEWGVVNVAVQLTVWIDYVAGWNDAAPDLIRGKLETLKSAMFAFNFASPPASLLMDIQENVTPEHPANSFIDQKNLKILAGMLGLQFVCGESAR